MLLGRLSKEDTETYVYVGGKRKLYQCGGENKKELIERSRAWRGKLWEQPGESLTCMLWKSKQQKQLISISGFAVIGVSFNGV